MEIFLPARPSPFIDPPATLPSHSNSLSCLTSFSLSRHESRPDLRQPETAEHRRRIRSTFAALNVPDGGMRVGMTSSRLTRPRGKTQSDPPIRAGITGYEPDVETAHTARRQGGRNARNWLSPTWPSRNRRRSICPTCRASCSFRGHLSSFSSLRYPSWCRRP